MVAEIAREMGILTVAVVTKPFLWEGPVRDKNAANGLEGLRKNVDTVIVVPNQKLLSVVSKSTPLREAFKMADDILSSATRGISDIILKHGDIQVDFADVRSIMSQGGDALMGTGHAQGENRATIAADRAIHSPLLDNISIAGATGVLVNITGGEDLGIMEVNDAMNFIYEAVGPETQTNIIFGTVINPEFKDEIAITVIATGFGQVHTPKQFSPKLTGMEGPKRVTSPNPAYPQAPAHPVREVGKPAPIVEPYRDYDRNTFERYTEANGGTCPICPRHRSARPIRYVPNGSIARRPPIPGSRPRPSPNRPTSTPAGFPSQSPFRARPASAISPRSPGTMRTASCSTMPPIRSAVWGR